MKLGPTRPGVLSSWIVMSRMGTLTSHREIITMTTIYFYPLPPSPSNTSSPILKLSQWPCCTNINKEIPHSSTYIYQPIYIRAHIVCLSPHRMYDPSLLPARADASTCTLGPTPTHLLKDIIQQTGSLDLPLFIRSFPSINNMLPTLKHSLDWTSFYHYRSTSLCHHFSKGLSRAMALIPLLPLSLQLLLSRLPHLSRHKNPSSRANQRCSLATSSNQVSVLILLVSSLAVCNVTGSCFLPETHSVTWCPE